MRKSRNIYILSSAKNHEILLWFFQGKFEETEKGFVTTELPLPCRNRKEFLVALVQNSFEPPLVQSHP